MATGVPPPHGEKMGRAKSPQALRMQSRPWVMRNSWTPEKRRRQMGRGGSALQVNGSEIPESRCQAIGPVEADKTPLEFDHSAPNPSPYSPRELMAPSRLLSIREHHRLPLLRAHRSRTSAIKQVRFSRVPDLSAVSPLLQFPPCLDLAQDLVRRREIAT